MARFCTKCGSAVGDDVRFCLQCGTPVAPPPAAAQGLRPRRPPRSRQREPRRALHPPSREVPQ